jgi:hypothetical protein
LAAFVCVALMQGATCLTFLIDPFCLLGMCALLSLLEAVDTLHVFAQEEKIFVSDFVATLKMTEGQLFSLYVDKGANFSSDKFHAFRGLLDCTQKLIHWQWIEDLNDS